ncbi:MAG TPA: hypothetical protein VD886_03710, partial [Herpetosiphonaceae bacterium]|nr:hypothetical protein [Herpetosiphonaceae bacterium]
MNLLKRRLAGAMAGICLALAGCGAASQTAPTSAPTAAPTSDPAVVASLCPDALGPLDQPIVAGFGGKVDIWSLRPDGIPAAQVTALQPGATIGGMAWSPDGEILAYTLRAPNPDPAAQPPDVSGICAINRATGKGHLLFDSSASSLPSELSWLPDGSGLLATYRYPIMNEKNEFQGQGV